MYTRVDLIMVDGNFNSQIRDFNDCIDYVDEILKRSILDKQCNKHAKELLDFLKDMKTCVLNGRFEDHLNNFTCISPRGKSIVDYCIVPHE